MALCAKFHFLRRRTPQFHEALSSQTQRRETKGVEGWQALTGNLCEKVLLLAVSCVSCSAQKNWCFWTVVLEKTLECPLDYKIQPVHPKGNQSWVFVGRTDVEAETPTFWPPDAKSWLIGKDPDAGKDWGQEEKGKTEDEMVGWHHWLDGHGFGWTPGVGDGQGGLACCGSWGRKQPDTTEQLNWTKLNTRQRMSNSIRFYCPTPPPGGSIVAAVLGPLKANRLVSWVTLNCSLFLHLSGIIF